MTQEAERTVRYEVQYAGHTLAIYGTGEAGLALAALPNFLPSNGYCIMATTFINGEQVRRRECWPGSGGGITPVPEAAEVAA
jgi:hypothetical protein